ncbi:hypothetical protein BDW59DRAFT_154647 [Aspergillus cavernicola]|uniref:Uncharacterized protein n=1 Tax=Aspergillus cavernicola TaxID=176166 RepID=A0ABR4HE84_9EURO
MSMSPSTETGTGRGHTDVTTVHWLPHAISNREIRHPFLITQTKRTAYEGSIRSWEEEKTQLQHYLDQLAR